MKFLNYIIYSYVTLYADTSPLFHAKTGQRGRIDPFDETQPPAENRRTMRRVL